jgi:hypothetical protein
MSAGRDWTVPWSRQRRTGLTNVDLKGDEGSINLVSSDGDEGRLTEITSRIALDVREGLFVERRVTEE